MQDTLEPKDAVDVQKSADAYAERVEPIRARHSNRHRLPESGCEGSTMITGMLQTKLCLFAN